ncbi:MAG: gliding motility protein GldL [Bacteroidales bacterium]
MMSIGEIVQTAGWRKFMAKVYGFGASVVLVGALFKLQHWPMAGTMLTVGLTTEALIFFFSAFEPLHEDVDWSIVYPELAGIEEEDPEEARERNRARREAMENFTSATPGSESPPAGATSAGTSGATAANLTKFDEMLENADISPELFERLGEGLKKLNETTENLKHVSDAGLATNQYVENIQAAAESISYLTDSYNKTQSELNENVSNLSGVFKDSAESIKQSGQHMAEKIYEGGESFVNDVQKSGQDLANSYKEISENVRSEVLEKNKTFNDQLETLNNHLAALNSTYELQLNSTNEHVQNAQSLYGDMNQIMNNLKDSVDETQRYRDEISKLNQNLSELNNVYGNMLSAMSVMDNNH